MLVELSEADMTRAEEVGKMRDDFANANGFGGTVAKGRNCDLSGALGEAVMVRVTGYRWFAYSEDFHKIPKNKRPGDVGPLEVRSTFYRSARLLMQKSDPSERPYVFVLPTEQENRFRVCGWRFGFECKKEEFWDAKLPKPCFAVPPEKLYRMGSLLHWCKRHGGPEWRIQPE